MQTYAESEVKGSTDLSPDFEVQLAAGRTQLVQVVCDLEKRLGLAHDHKNTQLLQRKGSGRRERKKK